MSTYALTMSVNCAYIMKLNGEHLQFGLIFAYVRNKIVASANGF